LIDQGLIHRIESLNAFIGCNCSGQQHEQLLLICKQCLKVEERPGARSDEIAFRPKSSKRVLSPHSKAIEIHGILRQMFEGANIGG